MCLFYSMILKITRKVLVWKLELFWRNIQVQSEDSGSLTPNSFINSFQVITVLIDRLAWASLPFLHSFLPINATCHGEFFHPGFCEINVLPFCQLTCLWQAHGISTVSGMSNSAPNSGRNIDSVYIITGINLDMSPSLLLWPCAVFQHFWTS